MTKKSRKKQKKNVQEEKIVTKGVLRVPKPTTEVVTEQREIRTEPEVEIRKPATLAQALTEPAVAVVRPKTRVHRKVVSRKVA